MSDIAEFLGRSLSAEETAEIVRRTRFDFMKTDPSVNNWVTVVTVESPSEFIRKGARVHRSQSRRLPTVSVYTSDLHMCYFRS